MNQPLVSVIIPNFNYGRYLSASIESVLAQSYPNMEVIVVDDGSTDNSESVARTFGDRIKFILQENSGVAAARNHGARVSRGQYLAFLDADDIWMSSKIEKQMELLGQRPETGFVTCGMEEFDKSGKTIRIYLEAKDGDCKKELLMHEPAVVGPGSTLLIKRALFEKIGGFDCEREMHGAEDWELCYRAATKSYASFVSEVLVRYRNHGDNIHLQIPKMESALLAAYDKVFKNAGLFEESFRKQSYGRIHSILAGSYYHAGMYLPFVRHALSGIWRSPSSMGIYLTYPLRRVKRALRRQVST